MAALQAKPMTVAIVSDLHVCRCVCMYVCVCVFVCVYVCVCVWANDSSYSFGPACVLMCVFVCMCVCVCVCVCVRADDSSYRFGPACVLMCVYAYMCVYIYTHIYVCMYVMYVCTSTFSTFALFFAFGGREFVCVQDACCSNTRHAYTYMHTHTMVSKHVKTSQSLFRAVCLSFEIASKPFFYGRPTCATFFIEKNDNTKRYNAFIKPEQCIHEHMSSLLQGIWMCGCVGGHLVDRRAYGFL